MKQSNMQTMRIDTLARLAIGVAVLATVAFPTHRAVADDETHDTEIRITAPIDTTSCAATPATITVLGLIIDVSAASIDVNSGSATPSPTPAAAAADDGNNNHGGKVSKTPPTSTCYYYCPPSVPTPSAACTALVAGQTVEVTLKSDSTPLTATAVSLKAGAANVEVQAPLQPIKAGAGQITLLGLTIDVSGAGLAGSDDSDATTQPIDLSELISGQVVDVQLVSNAAPLVATELDVKNFGNQIELSTEDGKGHPVNDVDAHGNPIDDVRVDVVQTVPVLSSAPAAVPTPLTYYGVPIGPAPAATPITRESKRLSLHADSNGRVTVSGLATGQATILITRVHGGVTSVARGRVAVKANTHRSIRLRFQAHASR